MANVNLALQCQAYLEGGPPPEMVDYVPGSLTEIIIEHGAVAKPLDPELLEIASLIVGEADGFDSIVDPAVKRYLRRGAELVRAVLESQ